MGQRLVAVGCFQGNMTPSCLAPPFALLNVWYRNGHYPMIRRWVDCNVVLPVCVEVEVEVIMLTNRVDRGKT